MIALSPNGAPINQPPESTPVRGLERVLRLLSVLTMLMTVPQILTIWIGGNAARNLAGVVGLLPFRCMPVVCLRNTEARQNNLPGMRRMGNP